MKKDTILDRVIAFVDKRERVTIFQVSCETGLSFREVSEAFLTCVDMGILEKQAEGEDYSVVQKENRLTQQQKEEKKILSMLKSLTDKERDFLQNVMDNHTRSEVNIICGEKKEFSRYKKHFIEIGLFENDKDGKYKLTFSESEYLDFWDKLWEQPSQESEKKENKTSCDTEEDRFPKKINRLEEKTPKREKESRLAKEIRHKLDCRKEEILFDLLKLEIEDNDSEKKGTEKNKDVFSEREKIGEDIINTLETELTKQGLSIKLKSMCRQDVFMSAIFDGEQNIVICGSIGPNGTVYLNDNSKSIDYVQQSTSYEDLLGEIEAIIEKYEAEKFWTGSTQQYMVMKKTKKEAISEDIKKLYLCIKEIRKLAENND